MRILILAVALALAVSSPVAASGPDGARLARAIASGDHDGARAHLAATISEPALHALHRTHLEGLIARQLGRHADAVDLFRAALVLDPAFVPARLELARTLLLVRNFEAAQHHFDILALNGDPGIRQIAQSGLDFIVANRGYGAELHLSVNPSSNLNRGSAHETFSAGDMDFTIAPDSRRAAGAGVTVGGSAFGSLALGNGQSIVARAGVDLTTDITSDTSAIALEQTMLNASLSWQGRMGQSRFALGPIMDMTHKDHRPHLLRYGLGGKVDLPAGAQNLVALSFSALKQDYAEEPYRNGFRGLASSRVTHALSPAMRVSFEVGVDMERTQLAHLDYDAAHAEVRMSADWQGGISTTAFARYARQQHLGDFPATDTPRRDDRLSAGVTVSNRQIDLGGFTPTLTYTYTRQFSNIGFFDHDSHDVSLGLTKAF